MTANPCHVRVRESSRGVSGREGKVEVYMPCWGVEGSASEDIESTSSECCGSGDEERLCGGTGATERSESVTNNVEVEGSAFNFIGAGSVDASGHVRSCGGSTLCLEILRGCSIGVGYLCSVFGDAVVCVGE